MKKGTRNLAIEQATNLIISEIDTIIEGKLLNDIPPKHLRDNIHQHLEPQGGSARLAALFLLAYSVIEKSWDFSSIPVGIRGKFGDKKLAAELTIRHITFHKNITAFGENLGWKGNVKNFTLETDPRFKNFIEIIKNENFNSRMNMLSYLCSEAVDGRIIPKALPNLSDNYLTYSRALLLFLKLCNIPSEGHIQQFVVASILSVHRKKFAAEIITHHPHASDKFDNTCGDIEEFLDGQLINAYEVTVRDDWKNRLPDLQEKMHKGKLKRYVLIASNVRGDSQLSSPEELIKFTTKSNFDLAIVDLEDFIRVFCSELKAKELREALNLAYEFLINPKLCGRNEFIESYKKIVDSWLDE